MTFSASPEELEAASNAVYERTRASYTIQMCIRDREKELLDGTFLVPDAMTVEEMLYKWIPIPVSYTHLDVYKRQGSPEIPADHRRCADAGYR